MSKRKCLFTEELQAKFVCFKSTPNSKSEAICTVCNTTVSVANKGKYDLEQHIASKKHTNTIRIGESSNSICNFFTKKFSSLDHKVSAVEGALAFHTLKHHYSYNSTVCTNKLLSNMFDDSEVAKRISSGKTKTRCIANNVIAPYCIENIMQSLSKIPFISVSTDGSNHGAIKMFPVLIQFFDKNNGIMTKMIDLYSLPNETAETISDNLNTCLKKYNIVEKCVAFSADNCNTNFGGLKRSGKNNVYSLLKLKFGKDLIGVGCPAHIVHNSAQHGFDSMTVDLESIILKLYNFFSIYTIRTESLKNFCEFVDIQYKALLKHSKTRWLSLYPAVKRVLEVYPALKAYFLSIDNSPRILKLFFEDAFSKAYLEFAESLMHIFHEKILEIESEQNSVLEVMATTNSLANTLHHRYEESFFPIKVKSILSENIKNGLEKEIDKFNLNCMNCYKMSYEYLKLWTSQLSNFESVTWMKLDRVPTWEEIENTIVLLASKNIVVDDVKCFDQFYNLKVFVEKNINIENFRKLITCLKWTEYFKTNAVEFHSELLKICQFFFAIPGQNANVERIFSMISGQWTKERNKLKISTVRGILSVVYNYKNISCLEFYKEIKENEIFLNKVSNVDKYIEKSDQNDDEDD